jgi:hypothetical protein
MYKSIEMYLLGQEVLAEPAKGKGIILQDIIINSDISKKGRVILQFVDDNDNTWEVYNADASEGIEFAIKDLNWNGWSGARLEVVNQGNTHSNISLKYEEFDEKVETFEEWSATKEVFEEKIKQTEIEIFETKQKFAELEMPIFATGKWNGKVFTEKDLDEILDSYKKTGAGMKPYIKLGHNDEQKLAKDSGYWSDGKPALGWIYDLKKSGQQLIAKVKDVPRVLAELVDKKAWPRVSCELWKNYEYDGVKYPWILSAVSLLGATTPAVKTLDDVLAFFSDTDSANADQLVVEFTEDFKQKEEMMDEKEMQAKIDEQVKLKEVEIRTSVEADLSKKFDEQKAELAAQQAKLSEITELFGEATDLKEAIRKFNEDKVALSAQAEKAAALIASHAKEKVDAYVEAKFAENKIYPYQKEVLKSILMESKAVSTKMELKDAELYGYKEEMTLEEAIMHFVDSIPEQGILKQFGSTKTGSNFGSKDEEAEALVQKYQEEHKCKYGQAQIAVSKMRPDLFEEDKA